MKEILKSIPSTSNKIVPFSQFTADEDKFYAVRVNTSSTGRALVTCLNYDDKRFTLRAVSCFSGGNGWDSWGSEATTLQEFIKSILNAEYSRPLPVYEFETLCDAANWVEKDKGLNKAKEISLQEPVSDTAIAVDKLNNDDNKFYGVLFSGRSRGFITSKEYAGNFVVRSIRSLTKGEGWPNAGASEAGYSISRYIGKLIDEQARVFAFDTFTELAQWLEAK